MRFLTNISRFLVGALFIFSGFIKANDPLGFAYKLDEYFDVFGMHWLSGISLFLAIFICIFEVAVGFTLLLGSKVKATLWLLLLMIIFFTFLTFYSAYFNKVNSCGCFGDAIPLTPWQSFSKDLILLVLIVILFIGRNNIRPIFSSGLENFLTIVFLIAATTFPLYTYNYLPVIDFRPYKIGTNIYEAMHPQLKYYYTLKSKKSGEEKEFEAWPENWESEWEYVSNRTEPLNKNIQPIVGFSIQNDKGEELTDQFLTNPNYSVILVAYDLDKSNREVQGRINDFVALCQKDSISFIGLTTSPVEKTDEFKKEVHAMYDYYRCPDDVPLKTMIRSNPGLIVLKAGVVIDMWHYHSFPSYNDLKAKYFTQK